MACNQLEGLGCALVTSKGTKAASGEALLAPFVLAEHTLVVVIPKIQTITVTTELTSWSKTSFTGNSTCIPESLIKEFLSHVKLLIDGLLIMQLKVARSCCL